jgi:hypothetical protein
MKTVMNKSIELFSKYNIDQHKFEKSVEFHNDEDILQKIHSLRTFNFDLEDSQRLFSQLDIGKTLSLEIIENYLELHRRMRQEDMRSIHPNVLMAAIEDEIKNKYNV